MWSEFGRLLKEYRKSNKLSQEKLLKRLRDHGYELRSKSTVSRWEHGLRRPKDDVVEELEDILGVSGKRLLRAARYRIETEPDDEIIIGLIGSELKKKEHSDQLTDIASMLLANGLDTLRLAKPTENQKDDPNWIEYFEKYKYRVYDYNSDSVMQATQKQLIFEMERNIEAVYARYKHDKDAFDCFLSHLRAEPVMEGRELLDVLDSNPLQLIEILKLMAQKKVKGTCPVCKDWL